MFRKPVIYLSAKMNQYKMWKKSLFLFFAIKVLSVAPPFAEQIRQVWWNCDKNSIRHHSFSTKAKFSKKLTFFNSWHAHVENFAYVLNEWPLSLYNSYFAQSHDALALLIHLFTWKQLLWDQLLCWMLDLSQLVSYEVTRRSVCPSVCPSVGLFMCLSVHPIVHH